VDAEEAGDAVPSPAGPSAGDDHEPPSAGDEPPSAGDDHEPPSAGDEPPSAGDDHEPPAAGDRAPPRNGDRTPEAGGDRTPPADGASASPAGDGQALDDEVMIVPGVARYHRSGCILIRFLGSEDLETSTRRAAEADGCIACRACEPDKPMSAEDA
jgi:hypothetical protein